MAIKRACTPRIQVYFKYRREWHYDISPLLVRSDIPVPVKIARDAQIFVLDITKLNIPNLTYQLFYILLLC